MLSEPAFWLIIAGTVIVIFGFIGLAFNRNRKSVHVSNGEQQYYPPSIDAENPKSTFGRRRRNDSLVPTIVDSECRWARLCTRGGGPLDETEATKRVSALSSVSEPQRST